MSAYKALSSKEGFGNLSLITKQLAVLGEAFPNLASALTTVSTAAASAGGGFASLAAGASAAMGTILPLIGIVAALSAGFLIYKQVQKHNEELRQSAVDSLEAYKDTARSIDEYKNKIKELRDELDSGNLTESEAASKKAELISIQDELNNTYGKQVQGLRLVNGELEQQLDILDNVAEKDLDDWYRNNKSSINKAKEAMTKEKTYTLADFFNMGSDTDGNVTKVLEDAGFEFEKVMDEFGSYTYEVKFKGNVTEAKKATEDVIESLENLNNTQYDGNNTFIDTLIDKLSSGKQELDEFSEKHEELYMNALKKEVSDKSFGSGTVADILNQYAKAVSDYNTALENDKGVERAKTNYEAAQNTASLVLKQYGEFKPLFDEVNDTLDESAIKAHEFTKVLQTNKGLKTFAKNLKGLSKIDLKSLSLKDNPLKYTSFEVLTKVAEKYGVTVDGLIEKLTRLGYVQQTLGSVGQGLNTTELWNALSVAEESANPGAKYNSLTSMIETYEEAWNKGLVGTDEFKAFTALISENGNSGIRTFEESIANIKRYFTEDSDVGMSNFLNDLSQYVDEAGKPFAKLNEVTGEWELNLNNVKKAASDLGIGLEPFMMLIGKAEDMGGNIDVFSTTEEGIDHLGDLYGELAAKQAELKRIQQEDPENTSAIQDLQDDIESLNQSIENTKSGLTYLAQDAANSYKAEFEQGKAAIEALAEERKKILENPDAYGDAADFALQKIEEVMTATADEYGITLTADFEIDESSFAVLKEKAENANVTFKGEFDLESADVDGQLDLVKQKIDSLKNEDGTLPMDSSEVQDCLTILDYLIAKKIEIEQPAIMSMDTSNLSSSMADYVAKLQEFQSAWNELQSLKMQADAGVISVDDSSIVAAKEKVDELFSALNSGENAPITADLKLNNSSPEELASSIGDVNLVGKITEVDVEKNGGYVIDVTINGQEDIDNLKTQIEGLPPGADVVVNATVTEGADIEISNIASAVSNLTDKDVTITVDGDVAQTTTDNLKSSLDAVDSTNPDPIITAIDSASGTITTVTLGLDALDGKTAHTYIITHKSTEGSGGSDLAGTAHQSGTAYESGNLQDSSWIKPKWKTKKDEVALTGEEDQELVAYKNKWWTVGTNGPEFAHIPKGAVVFNAKQTKELLSRGYTKSRGRSLLHGTAYAGGGIFKFQGGASYSPSYSSSSSSSSNSAPITTDTSKSIDEATDSAKEFSEELDEIEIKIDRIERAIKNIEITAESEFETYATRNNALKEQISAVNEEISIQQQGYERYMQQANSVGLDEEYAAKVRDGLIDIETITDETLSENIKKYQEW